MGTPVSSKFAKGAVRALSIQSLQEIGEHIPMKHQLEKALVEDIALVARTHKFPINNWKKLPFDFNKIHMTAGGAEGELGKYGYMVMESVVYEDIPLLASLTAYNVTFQERPFYLFAESLVYFADEFESPLPSVDEITNSGVEPVSAANVSPDDLVFALVGPTYKTTGFRPVEAKGTVYKGHVLGTPLLSQADLDLAIEIFSPIVNDFFTVLDEVGQRGGYYPSR